MNRIERFRQAKKQEGYVQQNVWLSPEERKLVDEQANTTGLTKSEIIRNALRVAYSQETQMNAAG